MINQIQKTTIGNTDDSLKTRKEAAQYLRVCLTTLARLGIPKTQVRRRVLYRQTVLDQWLSENTKPQAKNGER
ncbi:hypothetical protein FACS1894172_03320 [Spirochaetia bacterium]|nr:hypothetical protein FACS1894172_03320 [Spirochaetia bacterium]